MTTTLFSHRRVAGGIAGIAAAGALAFAGAGAANAATSHHFDAEHVDMGYVSLNDDGSALVLGTNSDPTGTYYAAGEVNAVPSGDPCGANPTYVDPDADFLVTAAAKAGGEWVLPDQQVVGKLFPGFAGAGEEIPDGTTSLLDALTPGLDKVDVTLDCQAFVGTGNGTATIEFSSAGTTQTGDTYSFDVADLDEAFHQHPKWTFDAAGTYYLTFHASVEDSTLGIADSNQVTYKVVVTD